MSVFFIALPVALAMGAVAVLAFVRAALCGQFDDLETPALRVLVDDEPSCQTTTVTQPGPTVTRM